MATSTNSVTPQDVIRKVGDTSERALQYLQDPDPQLSRLPRGQREALIADLPGVTAGALLGPAALARHLIASAASGRYRDLFALWELFRRDPDACRPVLADRPQALEKAREALRTAVVLGLRGHAERVARDVRDAEGLIWQWLREVLGEHLAAVGARPAVASALLLREPEADVPLPDVPDERWLAEAAAAGAEGELAPPVDARLAAGVDRLPATVGTLQLAHERYPDRVEGLIGRIDLEQPEAAAMLAWARDHGGGAHLRSRARAEIEEETARGRAEGLATWRRWRDLGVRVDLPDAVKRPDLAGLDLARPESAELLAVLLADGADIDAQGALDALAGENRQRAEKAYEAFVCAGLTVGLPKALEGNPIVKEGTRCPYCLAWTWVRPGHEQRCPRRAEAGAETGGAEAAGGKGGADAAGGEPAAEPPTPEPQVAQPAAEPPTPEPQVAQPAAEAATPTPAARPPASPETAMPAERAEGGAGASAPPPGSAEPAPPPETAATQPAGTTTDEPIERAEAARRAVSSEEPAEGAEEDAEGAAEGAESAGKAAEGAEGAGN